MRYIKQFLIIIAVSFIGEIMHYFIPLPVPASIYGIVIMFVCLRTHLIKIEQVDKTADFLIEIMPMMFIPASAGLIESWEIIRPSIVQYIIVTLITTVLVMVVSGRITQMIIRKQRGKRDE